MELKELYRQYGKLSIQLEITQGRMNEVKKQIAQVLNQKKVKK